MAFYENFITSDEENFITSDNKQLTVVRDKINIVLHPMESGAVINNTRLYPQTSVDNVVGLQTSLSAKLNKHIGTSQDAGKFLVVDSNGDITTMTMQQWTGGSY